MLVGAGAEGAPGGGGGGLACSLGVLFSSAAGGAHRPIATYCPSLGPFASTGGGAHRPLTTLCPSSLCFPFLSLGWSCKRSPRTFPVSPGPHNCPRRWCSSGGGGGTPIYKPQNDTHDALIVLYIHKWGENFSSKKISFPPISSGFPAAKVHLGRLGRGSKFFHVFHPFLNSPRESEHFEYKTHRVKRLFTPSKRPRKFFGTCGACSFPQNLKLQKSRYKNFWGSGGRGRGGCLDSNRPPPLSVKAHGGEGWLSLYTLR